VLYGISNLCLYGLFSESRASASPSMVQRLRIKRCHSHHPISSKAKVVHYGNSDSVQEAESPHIIPQLTNRACAFWRFRHFDIEDASCVRMTKALVRDSYDLRTPRWTFPAELHSPSTAMKMRPEKACQGSIGLAKPGHELDFAGA
jgi:hypothetical protein